MGKAKIVLIVGCVLLALIAGWQVGWRVLANFELQDDMQDLASQVGAKIGFSSLNSDEDFREAVVQRAAHYDLVIRPNQVSVEREGGYGVEGSVYLSADYDAPVNILGLSFNLHFHPSGGKKDR